MKTSIPKYQSWHQTLNSIQHTRIHSFLMEFMETSDCIDQSRKDETCPQYKMNKHFIKTKQNSQHTTHKGCYQPSHQTLIGYYLNTLLTKLFKNINLYTPHWSLLNTLLTHTKTSRAITPLNHFYTWCNTLLTGLHHSLAVSISFLLPSNSSKLTSNI